MRPDGTAVPVATSEEPIISLRDVSVHYALGGSSLGRIMGRSRGAVKALDGVDLDVAPGEVVGLVGESGSGKSTLGRAVLGLAPVTGGTIRYRGREIHDLPEKQFRELRSKLQMVFQDPHAALNPSMTVGQAVTDALRIHGVPADRRKAQMTHALERVGLAPVERFEPKYPSELSGGQKQRAVIARAIALNPELLVADEPISMLDMSVRAKILSLLDDLRRDMGLSFIYITHDLASARFFCDRVAILYLGKIVEIGTTEQIFATPRHPYTRALLAAVPDVDLSRQAEQTLPRGEVPDAAAPPQGCPFHPRCPEAFGRCGWEARDLKVVMEERWTTVDVAECRREAEMFGDLEGIATVDGRAMIRSRHPREVLDVLESMRAENPDEPFFSGVESMGVAKGGVTLNFAPAQRPELLPIEGTSVQVACHLHH